MYQITCRGVTKSFEEGASWSDAAKAFEALYEEPILLLHHLGANKLIELEKQIEYGGEAEFLTYKDSAGRTTYARSLILMLLRAFYRVVDAEKIEQVAVKFTIGGNFYIVPKGRFTLDEELLLKVKEEMQSLSERRLPIKKRSLSVDEAIRRFREHRMYDKSKLFHYRRVSRVNVYELDGFEDYFYGAMCAHTGLLSVFDLLLYKEGFMLMLPSEEDFSTPAKFDPSEKLFAVQNESFRWADKIGIETIGDLNDAICRKDANELILMQEAFFEKKIGEIAQRISQKDKKFILIAGPSSSGKTTTANRLSLQLRAYGIRPHIISADDYFVDYDKRPLDENGKPDFESLKAVDTELFNSDMLKLLSGETIKLPKYNFMSGKREYKGNTLKLSEDDVLIIEGIHCLNEEFSKKIPAKSKYKVYVSALTQLNIDEHNRIPTTDCRLLRRMVRDARTRGYSAQQTISRWADVRAGEEKNIFPYQDNADVMFNTSMIYELAVLKTSAEPLLFAIPRDSREYLEAKRLLKFLDYVLPLSADLIPKTSIVREFVGGSCLDVG